ncbi:phenylalanine--tRNA ligase subunit beta [Peptoniphilus equinus]|uniref:Phenylalanine--tRNA ligase beta subunit n=1 Tax=Peptoniphilus equinus TaxID=3016343 RepID=A0ABY7QUE7_9FIRM|nr:phenylalanine--tRNA ligase subunit beta [Peptoniphilus equinus]WBW50394.1 phenylalanine--tRNA ligase subunit beta [Peptoniphilus equinus]
MLLPVQWLENYVKIDKPVKDIADELSLTGSHVESITEPADGLSGVVVGCITKIDTHPDADKLVICQVDLGDETVQIVTGAKNVFEGAVVPVATHGAHLAGGVVIKRGKLRGVESNGMLCSLEELGFETSVIPKEARDGIYIFQEGVRVGEDALKALGMDAAVIEFEITPNRPDCLSIIGMARETGATFDTDIVVPEPTMKDEVGAIEDYFKGITIETDNCPRFFGKVLTDVTIEPSPQWMQNYLMSAGVRPINNIVDLTNFVMLEYGQPLHAYDLDDLTTGEIVVRQGRAGETLKTLDGEVRELEVGDVVITDGKRPIGLAGVMGGFDSEVKPTTKTVLLEGANFKKDAVRKTSKRLDLRSEASARFEKGVSPQTAKTAVLRVAQLAESIGAAKVVAGSFDEGGYAPEDKVVTLRTERANKLIGRTFTTEELAHILNRLDIPTDVEGTVISAHIPPFRLDLDIEEDLIEEVARIYGYHNITPRPLEGNVTVGGRSQERNLEFRAKSVLLARGLNEFMTYSFVSPKNFDKLALPAEHHLRASVKIINPLGEEYSIMRTTLVSNMLSVLAANIHNGNEKVGGFEFGNTFIPNGKTLPEEYTKLAIGYYDLGDFYFLKDTIGTLLWQLGLDHFEVKRAEVSYLHPGKSAEIFVEGMSLGVFGEVHPQVLENYDIKKAVYVAELDFYKLVSRAKTNYTFKPIAKFPSVKRDLAFVIDERVSAGDLEQVARDNAGALLETFEIFDIYRSEAIGKGKKSVAFSMVFRSPEKTLVDDEINPVVEAITQAMKATFDAQLRA